MAFFARSTILKSIKLYYYYRGSQKLLTNGKLLRYYNHYVNPQRQISSRTYTLLSSHQHETVKEFDAQQGNVEQREFQAETKTILNIVAKSLYSEKEVFIRELISNCSDALEKLRHFHLANEGESLQFPYEIHIETDKNARTFTIQDTGIGMNKSEIIDNLGTIARSGSKEFLQELQKSENTNTSVNKIIGQFGVGFYSTFMVADKVEVFTLSHKPGSKAYKWVSDGLGTYRIEETDGIKPGTKIIVHLKDECSQFSKEEVIESIIKKYSNFVNYPIFLNNKKTNSLQAVWLMDAKEVTAEMHEEFFRYITNTSEIPRYTMHYATDAPINLRCLIYIPSGKPRLLEMTQGETGISLYSHRILIKNKADVLPKWLWFVRGVIDSEDIPLNLSRELLQDSALIRKISSMITNRLLRYLQDQMKKDPGKYLAFYEDCGIFLKDGILASKDQQEKEEIAKLIIFESSMQSAGEKTNLNEYCSRMKEGQKDIYFLAAPSRQLAETSPYYEAVRQKNVEVLFCYEPYDEMVIASLQQFNRKNIVSVESQMRKETEDANLDNLSDEDMNKEDANALIQWLSNTLQNKAYKIKITKRLSTHPCLISVEEMSAARHYARTNLYNSTEKDWYYLLQPTMEVNLSHPLIKKLNKLRNEDPKLADLLANQVFDSGIVAAGLVDDPRKVHTQLNDLLLLLLEKH